MSYFGIYRLLPGQDIFAIIALILILELLDIFSFQLLALQPHPFWIPVVLAVVQYGTAPALTTVVVVALLDWALGWPQPAPGMDFYHHLLANLVEPMFWLLAIGLLGSVQQRQQDRSDTFEDEARQRRAQANALAEHCTSLRQDLAVLEHSLAVSSASNAGRCVELLNNLATAPSHCVEAMYRDVLAQLLGAEGIEIVLLGHGDRSASGAAGGAAALRLPPAPCVYLPAPVLDTLRFERRTVSCARAADGDLRAAANAAIVAPIPDADGRIVGAVVIRQIDPGCLSAAGEAGLSLASILFGKQFGRGRTTIHEADSAAFGATMNLLPVGRAASAES